MSNIKDRERFNRLDCWIWKKTRVDSQGRVTLPQKLRRKLGLNTNSSILWICVNRKNGKDNEFLLEDNIQEGFISCLSGKIEEIDALNDNFFGIYSFDLGGLI